LRPAPPELPRWSVGLCTSAWLARSTVPTGLAPVEQGFVHKKGMPVLLRPHRACPVGTEKGKAALLVQKPALHRGEPGGGPFGE